MANTKKKQEDIHDPEAVIESAIGRTEGFIESNSKLLSIIVIAIIAVIGGYFAYKYVFQLPRAEKAAAQMFVAEQHFGADQYQLALEGDSVNSGFLDIIDTYGSTPQANLAHHYAGICYLKLDKIDEALASLAKYATSNSAPGVLINAQNYGLQGDIYVQKGDYAKARQMFAKAVEAADNITTTPYYLKKEGLVCEKLGDNAAALTCYERISTQYSASMEARDIDKSIGRVKQK